MKYFPRIAALWGCGICLVVCIALAAVTRYLDKLAAQDREEMRRHAQQVGGWVNFVVIISGGIAFASILEVM